MGVETMDRGDPSRAGVWARCVGQEGKRDKDIGERVTASLLHGSWGSGREGMGVQPGVGPPGACWRVGTVVVSSQWGVSEGAELGALGPGGQGVARGGASGPL